MEKTYTIFTRDSYREKSIPEKEALGILDTSYHTGPYGYMGKAIDQTLYAETEGEGEPVLLAVRYEGEWLRIPDNQTPYMEAELGFNSFEC